MSAADVALDYGGAPESGDVAERLGEVAVPHEFLLGGVGVATRVLF